MTFRPDVNPYVELIKTKPGRILLGLERVGLSDDSFELLRAKQREFKRFALELGSGSGGHIVTQAANHPDTLFLGCELRFKRVFRTAEKADELRLDNLLVAQVNAKDILKQLPESCCDLLFILYPDPWEKQRWRKNRLVNNSTMLEVLRILKPGGIFEYRTDHQEYFSSSVKELSAISGLTVVDSSNDYLNERDTTNNVTSEFESLFKNQGLPLCRLRAAKS